MYWVVCITPLSLIRIRSFQIVFLFFLFSFFYFALNHVTFYVTVLFIF